MPEPTAPRVSSTIPQEVVQCLENARYMHLATSSPDAMPHISLMNYTYLPSSPYSPTPQIIMTTPPGTQKTTNLCQNPRVSLLVHDWVTTRPPTLTSGRESSPPPAASRSSLATLLLGMNSASLSRISVTINGSATFVPHGSDEEKWLKARHLENNTFGSEVDDASNAFSTSPNISGSGDGGRGYWVEGEEARVIAVAIKDGRISDWKGQITDWVIANEDGTGRSAEALPNGV